MPTLHSVTLSAGVSIRPSAQNPHFYAAFMARTLHPHGPLNPAAAHPGSLPV